MEENWGEWSDSELRYAAQGCTELSCLYHGPYNEELRRRGAKR